MANYEFEEITKKEISKRKIKENLGMHFSTKSLGNLFIEGLFLRNFQKFTPDISPCKKVKIKRSQKTIEFNMTFELRQKEKCIKIISKIKGKGSVFVTEEHLLRRKKNSPTKKLRKITIKPKEIKGTGFMRIIQKSSNKEISETKKPFQVVINSGLIRGIVNYPTNEENSKELTNQGLFKTQLNGLLRFGEKENVKKLSYQSNMIFDTSKTNNNKSIGKITLL